MGMITDIILAIVTYGFIGIFLLIVGFIVLFFVVEHQHAAFLSKLPMNEWLMFEETLSLGGRARSTTMYILDALVKKKRVETRLSRVAYSFAPPEEMKLLQNTIKFEREKAELLS